VLTGLGTLLLPKALFRILVAWRTLDIEVAIYQDGLGVHSPGRATLCLWNRICAVYCKEPDPTSVTRFQLRYPVFGAREPYHIATEDGQCIRINSYVKGIDALKGLIFQESAAQLLPRMRNACQSGGDSKFGTLSLNTRGVTKPRWLTRRSSA